MVYSIILNVFNFFLKNNLKILEPNKPIVLAHNLINFKIIFSQAIYFIEISFFLYNLEIKIYFVHENDVKSIF